MRCVRLRSGPLFANRPERPMKSPLVLPKFRSFCLLAATLFLALPAHGYRCNFLFRESNLGQTLLDPSWLKTAEREYSTMLVDLGLVVSAGQPLPEHNAGTIIYSYARRHRRIERKPGRSVVGRNFKTAGNVL